jgi:phosphonate transport system substrate-binding protein
LPGIERLESRFHSSYAHIDITMCSAEQARDIKRIDTRSFMTKMVIMEALHMRLEGRRCLVVLLAACFLFMSPLPGTSAPGGQLVFGVHPYKPATELEFMFGPLAAYLSSIAGKPVELRVSRNYDEHIEEMGQDRLDIAFMGPASYVQMVDRFGPKPLLARLEVSRVPTYYGVVTVARDSPMETLKDLKGKRIAFSDRHSTSGHLVPRHMFRKTGIFLEDFSDHAFMSNHDNVALGVLMGDFDAGAVNQEVFAKYEQRGLRILALTPPISEYLFVAGNGLPAEMVEALRGGLWQLKDAPGGGVIMRAIKPSLTALVPVEDSDYSNLRMILKELKTEGEMP